MNPIWKKTPVRRSASAMSPASASDSAGGFSQKVGFWASSPAITSERCVCVGLTMTTASTAAS